jgi:histidine ammonia-lyase
VTVAERELAAAVDNPVVLPDGRVESNGNFHGAPVAYVLDFLAIAVATSRGSASGARTVTSTSPAATACRPSSPTTPASTPAT